MCLALPGSASDIEVQIAPRAKLLARAVAASVCAEQGLVNAFLNFLGPPSDARGRGLSFWQLGHIFRPDRIQQGMPDDEHPARDPRAIASVSISSLAAQAHSCPRRVKIRARDEDRINACRRSLPMDDPLPADGDSAALRGHRTMGDAIPSPPDDLPIEDLGLRVRTYNGLRRAGISTIADLTSRHESELMAIPNFGQNSLRDVSQALARRGLGLSDVIRHPLPRPLTRTERSLVEAIASRFADTAVEKQRSLLRQLAEADVRAFATQELARVAEELGHPPDPESWERTGRLPSCTDIVAVFGSWKEALASIAVRGPSRDSDGERAEPPPGITTGRDRLPYRARRVLELREEGRTLDEVGQVFGITRERVRQIEKHYGGFDRAVAAEKAAARQLASAETHRDHILDLFRNGQNAREIARRLALPLAVVNTCLSEFASRADRGANGLARAHSRSVGLTVFSDDDLVAAIRTVADFLGRTPSSGEYLKTARAMGLPSLPTIGNRFGSWSAAVLAAGLVPRGSGRRHYARRWTDVAVRTALERLVIELGALPTVDQYELSAESDPSLPSSATVRNRLGRWATVAAELAAAPTPDELLAKLDIDALVSAADRQNRIWLAYMEHKLTERDLRILILSNNFEWNESFGPPPDAVLPAIPAVYRDDGAEQSGEEAD